MDKLVEEMIHNCHRCQASDKSFRTTPAPLQPVEFPSHPWEKLAIDITGPYELHHMIVDLLLSWLTIIVNGPRFHSHGQLLAQPLLQH